jgi:hypothetical protein
MKFLSCDPFYAGVIDEAKRYCPSRIPGGR